MRKNNLLLPVVPDGTVAAEEDRQDGHDDETTVGDEHALGSRGYLRRGILHMLGQVLRGHDLVHRICHLASAVTKSRFELSARFWSSSG